MAAEFNQTEAEVAAQEVREEAWRPEDIAVAGAALTLTANGSGLNMERGYARSEDEMQPEPTAPGAHSKKSTGET